MRRIQADPAMVDTGRIASVVALHIRVRAGLRALIAAALVVLARRLLVRASSWCRGQRELLHVGRRDDEGLSGEKRVADGD